MTDVPDMTDGEGGADRTGRGSTGAPRGHEGEWVVLRVSGELDLVTSPALRQNVHDVVAAGRHSVVLDLSEVVFCDSSGVGVLIAARRLMRSCRGRLRLILPAQGAVDGSHVNRVLGALGVRRLFDVYPDVDAATDEESSPLSA
ncbi:STAS domain-containing protein [Streptomyces sp. SAS_267]